MKHFFLVFIGGGLGSGLRYIIGKHFNSSLPLIPYNTLLINIVGCLLIGLTIGLAQKNTLVTKNTLLIIATGFCGGFTTFSAFAHENYLLLKNQETMLFFLYTIGSITLGIIAVFLGMWIVKFL